MNCDILDTLYLRANGDVPCNDDAGEATLLARVSAETQHADRLLAESPFAHIRKALQAGTAPWPGTCQRCALFRPLEPFRDDGYARRHIRKLQIEPSLACRLRCPGCSNREQIGYRPKPWILPEATLSGLLASLVRDRWSVDEVEYCGQGEPLLHPRFPSLVDEVRRALPGTRQRLITSGNADYTRATGRRPLDEVYVSCDGATQASYEQYRVRGHLATALRFLSDIPSEVDGIRQLRVWKYILFAFNDSDAEITRAQHLAQDLGVDQLLFVFTHSEQRSIRWTAANTSEFPILYPNVTTTHTAVHDQWRRDGRRQLAWEPVRRRGHEIARGVVDDAAARRDRLTIRGWAWRRGGLRRLVVGLDGRRLGAARIGMDRPDVQAVFPWCGPRTGFLFSASLPNELAGVHQLELELHGTVARRVSLVNSYEF